MVNSLLFRWEDSQALQHHCGFCERPLSHPGARASCFGTHSEPCHRFHQAMFMRNRAHICNYCSAIDEAHYKRHHELADQLRSIYEVCGEVDWAIVPAEPGHRKRERLCDLQPADCKPRNRSFRPNETPVSRRERKHAKCLARAASRARVVTQEEIRYVDLVMHSAKGICSSDGVDPANPEEIELIERNLRYNAHIYNSHSSGDALRKFAKIPEVDTDFNGEMERILDTFRITEIVERTLKNRRLQGKELRNFEALVKAFRSAVVEDLVLVKKDMMEIKMRRAGYLRYTNKTAHVIVEDRYTDKDWKTGDRIKYSSSDSSSLASPVQELYPPHIEAISTAVLPTITPTLDSDRRHLKLIHTRINEENGFGQNFVEPYRAPLLPLALSTNLNRPPVLNLKAFEIKENKENKRSAGLTNCDRLLRRDMAWQAPSSQTLSALEKENSPIFPPSGRIVSSKSSDSVVKPESDQMAASVSSSSLIHRCMVKCPMMDGQEFPALTSIVKAQNIASTRSDAPDVQAPTERGMASLRGPERALTPDRDTKDVYPIVSRKKPKNAQRAAKSKAKKLSDPKELSKPTVVNNISRKEVDIEQDLCEISSGNLTANDAPDAEEEIKLDTSVSTMGAPIDGDKGGGNVSNIVAAPEQAILLNIPPTLPCTTRGKHDHWVRFARNFVVDQLTVPLLQSFEDCSNGSTCLFESNGIPDCPFHKPYCSCRDPLRNQCFLMHPGKQLCSSGPYNRAHGERLMAMYEQHERTKGRVMLVDDDMAMYFMDSANTPHNPDHSIMPPRLLREHAEYLNGYKLGPLMRQELEFERILVKNVAMKQPLTTHILRDIQRQNTGRKGSIQLCYCSAEVQNALEIEKDLSKSFVRCSYHKCEFGGFFHKRCVKKLGVEKVSQWYCTACEREMKMLACKVLNILYIDDDAIMDRAEMIAETIGKPNAAVGRFMSRLQELYVKEVEDELEAQDVDRALQATS